MVVVVMVVFARISKRLPDSRRRGRGCADYCLGETAADGIGITVRGARAERREGGRDGRFGLRARRVGGLTSRERCQGRCRYAVPCSDAQWSAAPSTVGRGWEQDQEQDQARIEAWLGRGEDSCDGRPPGLVAFSNRGFSPNRGLMLRKRGRRPSSIPGWSGGWGLGWGLRSWSCVENRGGQGLRWVRSPIPGSRRSRCLAWRWELEYYSTGTGLAG